MQTTLNKASRPIGTLALLALATAGAFQAARAQSSPVNVYGTIDVGVGTLESQPPGPPNATIVPVRGVHSGGQQTSYFGVRGVEDLGDGLKARFQIESFLRVDTGQPGRFNTPASTDPFWSRSAWVGIDGPFGELRLGLVANPAWLANVFTSAMGSNSVFSPTFRQQYNGSTRGYLGQDTGLPNAVSYSTPRFGGVVATLAVQVSEGRGDGPNYNGSLVYRDGPAVLALAAANTRHEPPPDAAAAQDQHFVMLGGSYDFKAVRLFAQYKHFEDRAARLKIRTPHLGLTAPVGESGEVQLAWASGKNSGSGQAKRVTTSLGYIHRLSRRTNLYAMSANDDLPVGDAKSWMLGVRHTF